jgi:hypothetical protein
MTEVHGVPVSAEEKSDLDALRTTFGGDASLKTLDAFAIWLFASAGTLGSLAAAGKVVGIADLGDRGRRYFSFSILLFGISLALAALARMPQPSRFNPYDALSMRMQLNRIVIIRSVVLGLAAVAFAAALALAGFAPLQGARAAHGRPGFRYAVDSKGALSTSLVVADARPYSAVEVRSATRPARAAIALPQANVLTDGNGAATVALAFGTLPVRVVVISAKWRLPKAGFVAQHLTVHLRSKLAAVRTAAKKPKPKASKTKASK